MRRTQNGMVRRLPLSLDARLASLLVSSAILCATMAVAVCAGALIFSHSGLLLFAKPATTPVVNVAVAPADPADADAIPEGSELRARTLSVFDGAHAVTPGSLSDADYLYDLLSSETGDIAVLSADIRTPEAAANAAFIQNNPPPPEYTSIL